MIFNKSFYAAPVAILLTSSAAYSDDIIQNSQNSGDVTNKVDLTIGKIPNDSLAFSAGGHATGAVASVSINSIRSVKTSYSDINGTVVNFADPLDLVLQTSRNQAIVKNTVDNLTIGSGSKLGSASSISASATGAATSFSFGSVNSAGIEGNEVDEIDQLAINGPEISVTNKITAGAVELENVKLDGTASAVSFNAIGASSSIGTTLIETNNGGKAIATNTEEITQVSRNFGDINNAAGLLELDIGRLSGAGSSVLVSASGASVSTNLSNLNTGADPVSFANDDVTQTSRNEGKISNTSGSITTGTVSGTGAAVSVSAAGASSSFNVASLDSAALNVTYDDIDQRSVNGGEITNKLSPENSIVVGRLSGAGSSVSTNAVGASSSVNIASINSGDITAGVNASSTSNSITQVSINSNSVVNKNSSITTKNIVANGTSVSSSAAGASAGISFSSINSGGISVSPGPIIQRATNSDTIQNTSNTISIGNISGNGINISSSAVGASSSVNLTSIR